VVPAPRPTVWEHFTIPGHRPKWQGSDAVVETVAKGRRGAGTTNHCMHGKATIIEEVLDWRPFDYVTMATLVPMPDAPKVIVTYAFAEIPNGTRVEIRVGKPKPKDMAFLEAAGPGFKANFDQSLKNLGLLLAGSSGTQPVVDEPARPTLSERFLTEPVHAHAH